MTINWTKLYKKYTGQWIALKEDEQTVISSGKTAKDVMRKAKKKGFDRPILTRMPHDLHAITGASI